jgi:ribosomal protein L11 methyltransferase
VSSWILSLPCTREEAERLAGEVLALMHLDPMPSLVTSEEDEATNRWRLDAYFDGRPDAAAVAAIIAAIPSATGGRYRPEKLPDTDWVTLSQQGLAPVSAGRFFVHTSHDDPSDVPGTVNFRIDAGQAFGTGHHDTTAGCLRAIERLQRQGHRFTDIIDIGTGTGLLAFAALHLWPRAYATATDIDPVSVRVTAENAAVNGVRLGQGAGAVALAIADGTDHPLVHARAPYDLIIANILAGPLIALAPAFAAIAAPGTKLVLAGLIRSQRAAVVRACRRAGWRLDDDGGTAVSALGRESQNQDSEWPVLTLTMRSRPGWRRAIRSRGRGGLPPGDFGAW